MRLSSNFKKKMYLQQLAKVARPSPLAYKPQYIIEWERGGMGLYSWPDYLKVYHD